MRLRSIIRSSDLTADKRREIDEIIIAYNEKLFSQKKINKKYFSMLLLELIGCEYLFSVIPTTGIPTYDEFVSYDSNSDEFSKLVKIYEKGVSDWFEKTFEAMNYYVTLDSDEIKTETILNLIFIAGAEGQIKYNRKNKLAMICRMLYRMFGLSLR